MSSISIASLRLGKTSVQGIKDLNGVPAGITNPFEITVKCTQVPLEFNKDSYVLIWLGSDNSKGMPTSWKQGYKAFGRTKSILRGKQFNDESTTIVEILYAFGEAINRLDFLKIAPESYYDCSALPIIGIDDHSNQTIRLLQDVGERSSIGAMFYSLNEIDSSFKPSLIQINPELNDYFSYLPQSVIQRQETIDKLSQSASTEQKIYYGCPGTGKSFKVKKRTEGLDGEKAVYFDKAGNKIAKPDTEEERIKTPSNIFRTTFHPDYDYSTFVGTYKPIMKKKKNPDGTESTEDELRYDFVPQVFTNAYVRAWKSWADDSLEGDDKKVFLIIEEINRGNCAQIFGDLFQLLDRKDGKSVYPIIPDTELGKYLESENVPFEALRLPPNLHIYATMNTSDQSLFPMDSAFKRRWSMEYVPIKYKGTEASDYKLNLYGTEFDWTEFLRLVNAKIRTATNSEDKQMGEFFIKNPVVTEKEFINKVMFYIWNDVCKDLYSALRLQKPYFMRDTKDTYFTFAELFSGRHKKGVPDTEPKDLILGFMNYLKSEDEENQTDDAAQINEGALDSNQQ